MRYSKITAVALAAILSGGTLSAESWLSGKKENSDQHTQKKGSVGTERGSRGDDSRQHVSKPLQQHRPEVRLKADKTETTRRTLKPEPKVRNREMPVKKEVRPVRRPHYWVPPGAKPLPDYYRPGHVVRTLPKVAMTITLSGLLFYYSDGIYYRHHDSGFIVSVPPVGLLVPVLPLGYTVFQLRGNTYYYYADVYYVWDVNHRAYRVVELPEAYETYQPGDIVDTLPDGAYTVTIDGVQYYRYGEIYFMQAVQGERVVYIVVTP